MKTKRGWQTAWLAVLWGLAGVANGAESAAGRPGGGGAYATPPAEPREELQRTVQITEVGCMRTLLVLDAGAADLEKLVAQRLTDVDFRLFPSAQPAAGRPGPQALKEKGNEVGADLVVFAGLSDRKKSDMGGAKVFEADATVQFLSPATGEMFVSQTSRVVGERKFDEVEARRSARERALDAAAGEAVTKSLEKAHKLIVYRTIITNVSSHTRLLEIMEHVMRLQGTYHARQVSYDAGSREAVIEIIGSPKMVSFMRAHIEQLPRTKVVQVTENAELRKKYPSWF